MIKAVIFDMDGVLIDTEKHLVRCWCQAAREAGFPFTRENGLEPVSYTHLTLPTTLALCRSRWSPYH